MSEAALILIVDDHPINLKLASDVLASAGYRILQAGSAAEARMALAGARPDLIVMDIQLPDLNGLDFTRELKAHPDFQTIPVVALTAFAMKGDEEKARAAGCDGYITKPIPTRRIAALLAAFLPPRDGAPA